MHLIKLSDVSTSEKKLTQAVLQITQMLGIYHAELARILHFQCADIGELSNGHQVILKGSIAWGEAQKFIVMFEKLYALKNGDEALMNNWIRKRDKKIKGIPLYLMVDKLRIDDVLATLKL
jgi:hypothetical protein